MRASGSNDSCQDENVGTAGLRACKKVCGQYGAWERGPALGRKGGAGN